jgi:hypothetical protein
MSDEDDKKILVMPFVEEKEKKEKEFSSEMENSYKITEKISLLASALYCDVLDLVGDNDEVEADVLNSSYELMKQITGKMGWYLPDGTDRFLDEETNNQVYQALRRFLIHVSMNREEDFWKIGRWRSVFHTDDPNMVASEFLFVIMMDTLRFNLNNPISKGENDE